MTSDPMRGCGLPSLLTDHSGNPGRHFMEPVRIVCDIVQKKHAKKSLDPSYLHNKQLSTIVEGRENCSLPVPMYTISPVPSPALLTQH